MRVLDTKLKVSIAAQVCCAVAYLHLQPQPIVHRDIKPANILVNEYFVTKLCDLGLGKSDLFSKTLQSTHVGRWRGTLLYMAPEILLENKEANENSDIWSLGCTLLELFSEKHVWNVSTVNNMIAKLINQETPSIEGFPRNLQVEMGKCFYYNSAKRPNISRLLRLLEEK
ncbi:serine/threonine-protein kinase Nek6-like [Leptopilina boulardi]|uniref:serine/threonine-protein kinase Nek6-like n=1 Tax=Leptopilina boulardi TaxID=63433 RepID=UPI0021F60628|nr:serine/threonine-protein kinase Nek6-like [Leptopilina boulardi]